MIDVRSLSQATVSSNNELTFPVGKKGYPIYRSGYNLPRPFGLTIVPSIGLELDDSMPNIPALRL